MSDSARAQSSPRYSRSDVDSAAAAGGSALGPALAIAGYGLRESLRRRVFAVVLVLTAGFFVLYAVGAHFAFKDVSAFSGRNQPVDATAFTGATMFGLAMFAALRWVARRRSRRASRGRLRSPPCTRRRCSRSPWGSPP